jgi:hypothetical protein
MKHQHPNPFLTGKTDAALRKVPETEFNGNPGEVLEAADRGEQTVITDSTTGAPRAVIGLNGFRFLPDPSPDPLDDVIIALTEQKTEAK